MKASADDKWDKNDEICLKVPKSYQCFISDYESVEKMMNKDLEIII